MWRALPSLGLVPGSTIALQMRGDTSPHCSEEKGKTYLQVERGQGRCPVSAWVLGALLGRRACPGIRSSQDFDLISVFHLDFTYIYIFITYNFHI